MIGWKKIFAISSAIAYITLVVFYSKATIFLQSEEASCSRGSRPCVRFCSKIGKTDEELFLSFARSKISDFAEQRIDGLKVADEYNFYRNEGKSWTTYTIFRGEPSCPIKTVVDTDFKFDSVSLICLKLNVVNSF